MQLLGVASTAALDGSLVDVPAKWRRPRPPVAGTVSSFAAHKPLLKSVKSTWPFHGIAFITNGALAV
ncbi:hypothetical protein D3C83_200320 [compost metagenome]